MKVAFHTLGCKVNQYETQGMEALFREKNYEVVSFSEKADIYIVNTCTVTNMADKKSRQMLSKAKQMNSDALVVAVGCYVQAAADKIEDRGGVDLMVGSTRKNEIVDIVEDHLAGKGPSIHVEDISKGGIFEELWQAQSHEKTRAYIKIQDGCDQFCSYCIIPYTRGRVRSRDMKGIIDEIRGLLEEGYKEFVLTGIHLGSYGKGDDETSLIDVMERIDAVEGVELLRLGSLEPNLITDAFIKRAAALTSLCPHFHLSLQSGCDRTLKAMNRKYTIDSYKEKVSMLRNAFDRPAITTDIIVGFPGETEQDFEETLENLEEIGFAMIHVFKYSKRDGTVAAQRKDQIDGSVKQARSEAVQQLADRMKAAYEKTFIGETIKVLVEDPSGKHPGYAAGHAPNYIKVYFEADAEGLDIVGSRIEVKGTGFMKDGLSGVKL